MRETYNLAIRLMVFALAAALLLCAAVLRELGLLAGILPDLGSAAKAGVSSLDL